MKKNYTILLLCFLLPLFSLAQDESPAVKKRKKQLEKQEMAKRKESEQTRNEALEKHMRIQTKEVQKRMKKNKKKSNRINNNRKKFFLIRWFE